MRRSPSPLSDSGNWPEILVVCLLVVCLLRAVVLSVVCVVVVVVVLGFALRLICMSALGL